MLFDLFVAAGIGLGPRELLSTPLSLGGLVFWSLASPWSRPPSGVYLALQMLIPLAGSGPGPRGPRPPFVLIPD